MARLITGGDVTDPNINKEAQRTFQGAEGPRPQVNEATGQLINAATKIGEKAAGIYAKAGVDQAMADVESILYAARDTDYQLDVSTLTAGQKRVFDSLDAELRGALTARDQGKLTDTATRAIADQALRKSIYAVPGLADQMRQYASSRLGYPVSDTMSRRLFNMDSEATNKMSEEDKYKQQWLDTLVKASPEEMPPDYIAALRQFAPVEVIMSMYANINQYNEAYKRMQSIEGMGSIETKRAVRNMAKTTRSKYQDKLNVAVTPLMKKLNGMTAQQIQAWAAEEGGEAEAARQTLVNLKNAWEQDLIYNGVSAAGGEEYEAAKEEIATKFQYFQDLFSGNISADELKVQFQAASLADAFDTILNTEEYKLGKAIAVLDADPTGQLDISTLNDLNTVDAKAILRMDGYEQAEVATIINDPLSTYSKTGAKWGDLSVGQQHYVLKSAMQNLRAINSEKFLKDADVTNVGVSSYVAMLNVANTIGSKKNNNDVVSDSLKLLIGPGTEAEKIMQMEDATGVDVSGPWAVRAQMFVNGLYLQAAKQAEMTSTAMADAEFFTDDGKLYISKDGKLPPEGEGRKQWLDNAKRGKRVQIITRFNPYKEHLLSIRDKAYAIGEEELGDQLTERLQVLGFLEVPKNSEGE